MQNRRKQLIVNPQLQKRMVIAIFWPLGLAIAILAVALGVIAGQLVGDAKALGVEVPSVPPTVFSVLVLVTACIAFVCYTGLRISHRVAGPSYRLIKTMEAFQSGDRDCRARLREKDFLKNVAAELNDFLDYVQEQLDERPNEPERDEVEAPAETELV